MSRLPSEYDVHVVSAEGTYPMSDGRPIVVDEPGRNVVLVLATNQLVTWDIRWTEDSTLAGIWLINREYQVVKGVADDLPILNSMMSEDCARTRRRRPDLRSSSTASRACSARSPRRSRGSAIPWFTWNDSLMPGVLFVCLGNICRSPTAEGVLRAIAARDFPGVKLDIDSAGTASYHVGEPPDRRTVASARRRGYDLASQRARQVQRDDFTRFSHVLAMDGANLAELERRAPEARRRASRCSSNSRPRPHTSKCRIRTTAASRISSACSICARSPRAACCHASRAPLRNVRAKKRARRR